MSLMHLTYFSQPCAQAHWVFLSLLRVPSDQTVGPLVSFTIENALADPGFSVGGRGPIREGAWNSDVRTFHQKCMQK